MQNIFQSKILSILLFILIAVFYSGCVSDLIISSPNSEVTKGSVIIEDGAETTKDCTPALIIYSESAKYMSFSGDGVNWAGWVYYNSFYNEFNIANGLNGTEFGSGKKCVYIRFKDEEGNLSSLDKLTFDTIEYELGELYFIKIFPQEVIISIYDNYVFTLHSYDYGAKNEVPLDNSKVIWTKCCGVGNLSPTTGLSTSYTAPSIPGKRNITAQYNNLKTGAIIVVVGGD